MMIDICEGYFGVQYTEGSDRTWHPGTKYKQVFLRENHPECEGCNEDCDYCCASLTKPVTFSVVVRFSDGPGTEDRFKTFAEAFESFSNIVKLWNEEDIQEERDGKEDTQRPS